MSEAVIRRLAGNTELMAEQLSRMVELSKLDHVTIQVVPFEVGIHAASGFNFVLLEQLDPKNNVVFLESLAEVTWLEDPRLVEVYANVFKIVSEQALSPSATRKWLATVGAEL